MRPLARGTHVARRLVIAALIALLPGGFAEIAAAAPPEGQALGTPGPGGTTGTTTGRVLRTGVPSTCAGPKAFPGIVAGGTYRYDAYQFTNPGDQALCLTVSLATTGDRQLFSVTYHGDFDPDHPEDGYAGDAGRSTNAALGWSGYALSVGAGETVTVLVAEATAGGGAVGQPYDLRIAPTGVGFVSASATGTEGAPALLLGLKRFGDLSQPTTVSFATADGLGEVPAISPSDYQPQSGTASFAAGEPDASIQIALVDDDAAEPSEQFRVLLTDAGTGAAVGPYSSVMIDVRDDDPRPVQRVAGEDRIATAIEISKAALPDAELADSVLLASAAGFADALAGTSLAVARNGVVLLTPPDSLDPRVTAEIGRVLQPDGTVFVLGGPAAVSPAVVEALDANGFRSVRLGGADRYETAVVIARLIDSPSAAYLATGRDFPDALAAGAAAGVTGGVVLLTDGPVLPDVTRTYLGSQRLSAVAVGGDAARAMPSAERIVGADRYETAALLADAVLIEPTTVAIASGEGFPDAVAGGAHVAALGGALLLTRADALPEPTATWLAAAPIVSPFVYGGPAVISDAVVEGIDQILRS
jgi:hypothetical protein